MADTLLNIRVGQFCDRDVETLLLFDDKYDCEYDGWGTAVAEAARPAPKTI